MLLTSSGRPRLKSAPTLWKARCAVHSKCNNGPGPTLLPARPCRLWPSEDDDDDDDDRPGSGHFTPLSQELDFSTIGLCSLEMGSAVKRNVSPI